MIKMIDLLFFTQTTYILKNDTNHDLSQKV